jgi:hypothetical protein
MPRNIDPTLLAALSSSYCEPVHLMQIKFRTQTAYAWTGVGDLVWNGNTFKGVGSLGMLGDIKEGTEVRADGTSVLLSGIDPIYLAECLTDVWVGAPAYRWLGAVQPGTRTLIGTPYMLFSGQVDKPTHYTGPDKSTISLALETRLINHTRASNRRLTTVDQRANGYPDDTGFVWVERLNDTALDWE